MAKQPKPIDPNNCGIYQFLAPSGHCYIGQSTMLKQRRQQHWGSLRRGSHKNFLLQRGFDAHKGELLYRVLELCPPEVLTVREQFWIDSTPSVYNLSKIASAPMADPKVRAKAAVTMSALRKDPEYIANHRAGVLASRATDDYKSAQRRGLLEAQSAPSWLQNCVRAQSCPSQRALNGERQRASYVANPERRKASSAFQKEYQNLPEVKARSSAFQRWHQNLPEVKAHKAACHKTNYLISRIHAALEYDLITLSQKDLLALYAASKKPNASPLDRPKALAANNWYKHVARELKRQENLASNP